ncbi:MAG: hypothetical protein K6G45_09850 [Lachnospiraceae bacterium]|nr:hypothetical protein [Lachnospiraceae bacterium]
MKINIFHRKSILFIIISLSLILLCGIISLFLRIDNSPGKDSINSLSSNNNELKTEKDIIFWSNEDVTEFNSIDEIKEYYGEEKIEQWEKYLNDYLSSGGTLFSGPIIP